MLGQPIAILGGGNIGHIMAASLTLGGYDVNFYEHPQFKEAFKTTLEGGQIEILDDFDGRVAKAKIHKVTVDMNKAISDAKLIFVIVPSFGHDLFFNAMIPHLKEGHIVWVLVGNSGALRLRELLRQKAPGRKIHIYECANPPNGGRLLGPAKVRAFSRNFGPWFGPKPRIYVENKFVISGLPAKDTYGLDEIVKLYPEFIRVRNVLVVALNNPHHLIHTPLVILNVGRIEGIKEDFIITRDGQTPSIQRVQWAICDELAAMVYALGDTVALTREVPQNWQEIVTKYPVVYGRSTAKIGTVGITDRKVTEDCPYGLVPMAELGRKLGVATRVMDVFVTLASVINQVDYRKSGRNLESLGLAHLNKEQIINLVENEDLP